MAAKIGEILRSAGKRLFRRAPFWGLYEMFYQSGLALRVEGYVVRGHQGLFLGPLYDQAIMKTYLKRGHWSLEVIAILRDFFALDGNGFFYDVGANVGL